MRLDDLAAELLEGLRDGRDLADVHLEPAFESATYLSSRAADSQDDSELAQIGESAKACIGVIEGGEGHDFVIRITGGSFFLGDLVAIARDCWEGPELLAKLAQRFHRARFIALYRRRALRTGRAEFVTYSNKRAPRSDTLPALRAWTRQRGASRQTRAARRVRPPARAPARLGDEPPPPADPLGRPSERRAA